MNDEYPTVEKLWHGAILQTIVHATFSAPNAILAYEVSWDGHHYLRNDTQGTRGIITFVEDNAIGLFGDIHSERSPYRRGVDYDFKAIFAEMPGNLRKVAEDETSQYILDNLYGQTIPIITATFWSNDGRLCAQESWQSVLDNGVHLIQTETLEFEAALQEISDDYEFTTDQIDLIKSLFERRLGTEFENLIALTEMDMKILVQQGNSALEASQELFKHINIVLPQ